MAKWKLFGKSKNKKEEHTFKGSNKIDLNKKSEGSSLAEHHETLYEGRKTTIKDKSILSSEKTSSNQRIWRNVDSIENNVDKLTSKQSEKKVTQLDKTVDKLITKGRKTRKPSNVIYVVNKPQPGQVRGDWAVRGHSKIYSHHRTKQNAINKARIIARDKGATVMVQNTDGTFSEGFKPKPKKR